MSSIIKLSIVGVRAFDNHDRELIAFGKPLTLIAGPNGVGKTTIIECLRYATTGDLPPNSKGGAFVHDPRMSGEREVLAQVKLSFYSTNGVQMVCTRSMQLTVKKTTQTFKTLEGQLLAVSGDRKQTVSSRCADLDIQVPHSLGVSAAVLNYVIFCHQEDSLWPLAEPSVVKKRFDEIFEATKFTKALDTLKALRKDYGAEIKVQEKTAQYLRADEERAAKLRSRMSELAETISSYEKDCASLKHQIDDATIRLNRLFEITRGFQQKSNQLDQMRESQKSLGRSIENLLQGLEVLDLDTAEIERQLNGFDSREETLKGEYEALQEDKSQQLQKIKKLREEQSKFTLKKGKLEAEFEQFKQQRSQLAEIAAQTAKAYGSFDIPLADRVLEIVSELTAKYERVKTDHRANENALQTEMNRITATKLQIEQQEQAKSQDLETLNVQVKQMTKEIEQHSSQQVKKSAEHHKSLLDEYEQKQVQAHDRFAKFTDENRIEATQKQVFEIQAEIESSNRALARATTLFSEQSKLMVLKDSAAKKKQQLQSSRASLKSSFEGTVGLKLCEETLEKDFSSAKESLNTRLVASQTAVHQLSEGVSVLSSKIAETKKNQDSSQKQVNVLQKEIETAIGAPVSSFDDLLAEAQEDLQVATQNMEQSSFTSQYYEAAKANAVSNGCCLLCQRSMKPDEQKAFAQFLNEKLGSMPLTKEDALTAYDTTSAETEKLRALVPQVTRFKELKDIELPKTQEHLKTLEVEFENSQDALNKARLDLNSIKSSFDTLIELERPVSEFAQIIYDLELLDSEITSLSESSVIEGMETPQQIQARLTELNQKGREEQRKLQDLKDEESLVKDEVARWVNMVNKKKLELKNMELEEQGVKLKHAKLEDARGRISQITKELPELRDKLHHVLEELESAEEKLKEEKVHSAKIEKALSAELSEAQSSLNEFSGLNTKVDGFLDLYGENPLVELEAEATMFENELTRELATLDSIDAELQSTDRRITDFRGQKRILQDNLQLRRYREEVKTIESSLSKLEKELADSDKQDYENQTLELQDTCTNLNSSYSSKLGEIKQMQDQEVRLETELANDYATVTEDARRAGVKLESTVVATEDIGKYLKALDAAIMQYHSVKMREINQVLDELWKKTYKGTDVDTIMIKGESEGKGARTYNYRVCMIKQDTELDMRGRCSAGQKVLASVIIRLALSECFGAQCGLIVLDEPTTNLDRANSEALARSLSVIIEARRAQRNFQLIVISHDEHFLGCMNAAAYCDHFYRIERDMRQMSRIERLPIGLLQ